MIRIAFHREGGALAGFEARGHAGHSAKGTDVVCAAVSAILLTALAGLKDVVGANPRALRRDSSGYLRVAIPSSVNGAARRDADLALRVARSGLEAIARDYPESIEVYDKFGG